MTAVFVLLTSKLTQLDLWLELFIDDLRSGMEQID